MSFALALVVACTGNPRSINTTSQTTVTQASPSSAGKTQTIQETNDAFVVGIQKQIAGREQEPAEKVFKNIQIPSLKPIPARQLLAIMNLGYSRALGVTCTHCHDERDFAKDDKRPKGAAREMAAMHRSINDQLSKMQNLKPRADGHFVNCNTCHRGNIDPGLGGH